MAEKGYLVRKTAETPKERSTCGFRQRLITKEHFERANLTFLSVYEAERSGLELHPATIEQVHRIADLVRGGA